MVLPIVLAIEFAIDLGGGPAGASQTKPNQTKSSEVFGSPQKWPQEPGP